MPVMKVKGGYRWGSKGKVYRTKAEAERQGRAAHAAARRHARRAADLASTSAAGRSHLPQIREWRQDGRPPDVA